MKNILIIGTFDFLHVGHFNLFLESSRMGNIIIGVTSDKLNSKNNAKDELFFDQNDRIKYIEKIRLNKEVVLIDPTTGNNLDKIVKDYKITHIAMGTDYLNSKEKINLAKRLHVKIIFIERTDGVSSTELRRLYK